ncbi:MAG: GntR family transcriptional regulator, partial [Betaproteobacteria bacterium]|nr:GntR family transcriptional regulator [Betaproteobacteria bacterium]
RRRSYAVGDQLPSEAQLQKEYGVSKFTVREALKRLERRGFVERRHGVGTIVVASTPRRPINYVVRDIDEFIRTAPQARLKKLAVERRALRPREAEPLGLAPDDQFAVVQGVRVLAAGDEETIAYVKVYVPDRYSAVAEEIGTVPGLVATLIEQHFGVSVDVIRQEISAPLLDDETRIELKKANLEIASERTLVSRRWYLDKGGEIIICSENIFVDPDFSFDTVLSRTA